MDAEVLTTRELESLLNYPRGRAMRLVRAGGVPHVVLPDGSVRFLRSEIMDWLRSLSTTRPAQAVPA